MKAINWAEVSDGGNGGYADLPTGGYVLRVTEVIDEEDFTNNWGDTYDRIVIRYDVAEGEYADFFTKNNRPDFAHEHEFRYNPENCGDRFEWSPEQFKTFWNMAIDGDWDFDPKSLIGRKFGATIRHRHYTKSSGEDGSSTQIQGFYSTDRIREGKFKAPKDIDNRKAPTKRAEAPKAYTDDLPF